jgi:mono/diheme cytochrome c family protein
MRPRTLVLLAVLVLVVAVIVGAISQIRLDAISEPGRVESFLATQAKHVLISWYSRHGIPPGPTDLQASIKQGDTLYGTDCSMCHGADGHTPTDNGRWMYPRASDLTSPGVGQYTDRELFWIIKNGIRLTGMPAFGKVESDENIWDLANYVKTLQANAKTGK